MLVTCSRNNLDDYAWQTHQITLGLEKDFEK